MLNYIKSSNRYMSKALDRSCLVLDTKHLVISYEASVVCVLKNKQGAALGSEPLAELCLDKKLMLYPEILWASLWFFNASKQQNSGRAANVLFCRFMNQSFYCLQALLLHPKL